MWESRTSNEGRSWEEGKIRESGNKEWTVSDLILSAGVKGVAQISS
jgi:hypothetical protein